MSASVTQSSKILTAIAYTYWSSPITYAIAISALYNLPATKAFSLFLSIYYILRSCLNLWVAWGLHKLQTWSWSLFVCNSVIMIMEQFYIASVHAENHSITPSLLLALFAIFAVFWLVRSEIRVPYFSPKIAWWESDPRYKISVPTSISAPDHFFEGQILDISPSGCFIKVNSNLKIDETITLSFILFEKSFRVNGHVVWKTDGGVTHPRGIGIRFTDIEKQTYSELKQTVKKLKGLTKKLYRQRRAEKTDRIEQKVKSQLQEEDS